MESVSTFWFNAQFTLGRAPYLFRLKGLQNKIITPSIQIDFENQFYKVKTANTPEELAQVLALRFEVFYREFSTKKITFSLVPYDIDVYDFLCDHLIVKDKSNDKVVACYRLITNNMNKKLKSFYSEGEFQLEEFLALPGNKLELGRACVHKDYRKGSVISLLWRGLLDYAKKSDTRYMFGCSSINRKDFENVPQILQWLKENNSYIEEFNLNVRNKYKIERHTGVNLNLKFAGEDRVGNKVLGSLMYMYVMAGAKMGKVLAYDSDMDCLDIFTVIDLHKMPSSFERRFAQ